MDITEGWLLSYLLAQIRTGSCSCLGESWCCNLLSFLSVTALDANSRRWLNLKKPPLATPLMQLTFFVRWLRAISFPHSLFAIDLTALQTPKETVFWAADCCICMWYWTSGGSWAGVDQRTLLGREGMGQDKHNQPQPTTTPELPFMALLLFSEVQGTGLCLVVPLSLSLWTYVGYDSLCSVSGIWWARS